MNSFLILNTAILEPGKKIQVGDLLVRNGRIAGFGDLGAVGTDGPRFDGRGRLLTPGLVDVHTHGILRFKYENGADDLRNAVASLARFGVTTVLPTIVPPILTEPGAKAAWLRHLAATAAALAGVTGIHVPGLHLEGPFLAITGATAATMDGDLGLLDEILQAAGGSDRCDVGESRNMRHPARDQRIAPKKHPSVSHAHPGERGSDAGCPWTRARGMRRISTMFSIRRPKPTSGCVRWASSKPSSPIRAQLWTSSRTAFTSIRWRFVRQSRRRPGPESPSSRTLISGQGLPPGVYDTPWGYAVRVSPETGARHAIKHTLSGSALTMNRGMQNLLRWLALPPEQIWAMGTLNPCRLLELPGRGVIECGAVADLVLWEEDLMPAMTWSEGNCVYRGAREPERPS
jgi:N-acetylglucosamine-6-phosphate deacetylase